MTDSQEVPMTPREVVNLIAATTRWPDRLNPWSLSELRLNEAQRESLLGWCSALTDSTLDKVAAGLGETLHLEEERVTAQAAFGVTLLLAFSEIARREASEGRLWGHVRKTLSPSPGSGSPLFNAGGQPTGATKMLLERGARRFGLRHAFDLIDHDGYAHHWYTTVFLQFGITRRGFEQNASNWLRNQNLSRTIRLLLDRDGIATGSGRPLYSQDFENLWTTLILGARNNIKGPELRSTLAASCWIPPEDVEGLARALEILDWESLGDDSIATDLLDTDFIIDTFIGNHRWILTNSGPALEIEMSGLSNLELDDPYYDIVLDGRRAARLLTTGDTLRLMPLPKHDIPGATLAFRAPSPLHPTVRASLLNPHGGTRAAQELHLWPANDVATSVPIGSSAMASAGSQSQLVIADTAIKPVPSDIEQYTLDDGRFFCFVSDPTGSTTTELMLGDDVVWTSQNSSQCPKAGRQRDLLTASLVSLHGDDASIRTAVITISGPNDLVVTSVWAGQSQLSIKNRPGGGYTIEISIPRTSHEINLVVVTHGISGGLTAKRINIDVPLDGFFRVRGPSLQRCPSMRSVTRGSITEGRYIFLPNKRAEQKDSTRTDWTIFEGSRPLARMPFRGQPRLAPFGLGWPLVARYRPVNAGEELQLCSAVVNFGDLHASHDLSPSEDGIITLGLHDSLIDQLAEYTLVIWDRNGEVYSGEILEVAHSSKGYTTVRGLGNKDRPSPVSIGLSYRGFRAGAVWTLNWHKHIRTLAERDPENAAALIRWLQLPVATPLASTAIHHELLQPYPVETIIGFTSQKELATNDCDRSLFLADAGFRQPGALDTPWYLALRETIGTWQPCVDSVEHFIDSLLQGTSAATLQPTPLIASLAYLVRISPRLAIGTAVQYSHAVGKRGFAEKILTDLALHLGDASSTNELARNNELLLEQAAGTLGTILRQQIDPMFVTSLLSKATMPDGWMGSAWSGIPYKANRFGFCDSELLCQFPDGRRLLSIQGALQAGGI